MTIVTARCPAPDSAEPASARWPCCGETGELRPVGGRTAAVEVYAQADLCVSAIRG